MNDRIYSDLALESSALMNSKAQSASEYSEQSVGDLKVCTLDISTSELEKKYGRKQGTYITIVCGKIHLFSEEQFESSADIIGKELRKMISGVCRKEMSESFSALVAGLGNAEITPDSIGPLTVSHLTVTRHIGSISREIFGKIGQCSVAAVAPGVLAQTGIETLELIRGISERIKPDVIIAVDALAARSCERLAATVQISDCGISPGSGIGNIRKAINRENLGLPVIALGVPTVVDSATLVYDALEKAGITEIGDRLKGVLDNERGFFVSPKESDVITDSIGLLLARSLDAAFCLV
ncbi:MAG: GPR endopeptidase [Clostridia bacterium]|nr:GPR endopeptidase [Clostridia bacterium]